MKSFTQVEVGRWAVTSRKNATRGELEMRYRLVKRLRLGIETGEHLLRSLVKAVKVDKVSKEGLEDSKPLGQQQHPAPPSSCYRGIHRLMSLGSRNEGL